MGGSEATTVSGPGHLLPSVPSDARIFSWIEALTRLGARTPDSQAAIAAAEFIRGELAAMGLSDVGMEEAPTRSWSASEFGLTVAGRDVPCSPIHHTFTVGEPCLFSTGPGGLTADIVYIGRGSAAEFAQVDVTGKIVVCEFHFSRSRLQDHEDVLYVHDPAGERADDFYLNPYNPSGDTFPTNYLRAQAAGAAGYVGVLVDYYRKRHSYANEAYASYDDKPMAIPGLWVSAAEGEAIRAVIQEADEATEATLILEGELARATSRRVVGRLPGSGPDRDETVVVESHYDSIGPGATQDASGTAAVLALAESFSGLQVGERNRSLLFVLNDTHFGDYAAHEHFIANELRKCRPVAAVSVEHIALDVVDSQSGPRATGKPAYRIMWVTPASELVQAAKSAVIDRGLERVTIMSSDYDPDELGADTHDLWRIGVPVVSYLGVPIYMYDQIDTLDKVDRKQLRPTVQAFVDILVRIDNLPSASFAGGQRTGFAGG